MHPLKIIFAGRSQNQTGVYSVCTANELVIRSVLRHAKTFNYVAVVEATANQVNQFGGYTGMHPAEYASMVKKIAAEEGLPDTQLILGGDHLGPLTWQDLPELEAMNNAEQLVREYTLAGFSKIHLDTSMRIADDDPATPLDVRVCARRGARLAIAVESAYQKRVKTVPSAVRPVLVIGSEVPIPGGSQNYEDSVQPTDANEFRRQYAVFKEEFDKAGAPFEDVVAFVVQPGVEFGDDFVCQYNPQNAAKLTEALMDYIPLVFEGHSTDYQTQTSLSNMVRDGIRILKVGPALTFCLREALLLLESCERILVRNPAQRSDIQKILLEEMKHLDRYWRKYYSGTEEEIDYKKIFSYCDRCRYYLPVPTVKKAVIKLLENTKTVPVGLISQYFPQQYKQVANKTLQPSGESLLLSRVGSWCDMYATACGVRLQAQ